MSSFDTYNSNLSLNENEHIVNSTDDDRALVDLSVNEFKEVLGETTGTLNSSRSWSSSKESMLQQWAQEAYGYRWMHNRCIEYFQRKDKRWWISAAIISILFSGGGITSLGLGLPLLVNVITYAGVGLGTGLSVIHANLKYSALAEKHKEFESMYNNFIKQIQEELAKKRDERHNGTKFIESSRKEIKRLMDPKDSPYIPIKIINMYKKFITKSKLNIHMPPIAGGIETLVFNETELN